MRSAVTRCPRTRALLERAATETGLPIPQALSGWAALIERLGGNRRGAVGDDPGRLRP